MRESYDWGDPEMNRIEALHNAECEMADRHMAEYREFVKQNPGTGEWYLNIMNHETGGELQDRPSYAKDVVNRMIDRMMSERDNRSILVWLEGWRDDGDL